MALICPDTKVTLADCRPEVLAFAIAMEKARRKRNPPLTPRVRYLLPTIADTRVEFREVVEAYLKALEAEGRDPAGPNEELLQEMRDQILENGAHMAQFIMQVVEVCGGFKK